MKGFVYIWAGADTPGAAGSVGTGAVISPSHVLTAAHVIKAGLGDSRRILVRLGKNPAVRARCVYDGLHDESPLDVAVLETEAKLATTPLQLARVAPPANSICEFHAYDDAGRDDENHRNLTSYPGKFLRSGESDRRAQVGVDYPPNEHTKFRGGSGAPVVVDEQVVALVRQVAANFVDRIDCTPVSSFIDIPAIKQVVGGSSDARGQRIEKLVEARIADSPQLLAALRNCWGAKDAEARSFCAATFARLICRPSEASEALQHLAEIHEVLAQSPRAAAAAEAVVVLVDNLAPRLWCARFGQLDLADEGLQGFVPIASVFAAAAEFVMAHAEARRPLLRPAKASKDYPQPHDKLALFESGIAADGSNEPDVSGMIDQLAEKLLPGEMYTEANRRRASFKTKALARAIDKGNHRIDGEKRTPYVLLPVPEPGMAEQASIAAALHKQLARLVVLGLAPPEDDDLVILQWDLMDSYRDIFNRHHKHND